MVKRRRQKSSIRSTSKSLERRLIERGKALKRDPALILPTYSENCKRCKFDSLRKKLANLKDLDELRIKKASRLNNLVGAVAATISLTFDEKAPYLMIAHMPQGDVSYALKGKADRDLLIGVQYYDDPFLRLFAFKDLSKKKKLHIYSWKDYLSCSDTTDPPEDFISWVVKRYEIEGHDIKVKWGPKELEFGDEKSKMKVNSLSKFLQYTAIPELEDLKIEINLLNWKGPGPSTLDLDIDYSSYIKGEMDDLELFRKYREELKNATRKMGLFISGNDCYGADREQFISSLEPNEVDRKALNAGLKQGIYVDRGTPSKVIEAIWEESKEEMVMAVVEDSSLAREVLSLRISSPSDRLNRGYFMKRVREIGQKLPTYTSLPEAALVADEAARAYKAEGESLALGVLDDWMRRSEDTKVKSVIRAFLSALNAEKSSDWRFNQIEMELGEYLKGYALDLLKGEGESYDSVLKEMVRELGITEEIS